MKIYQKLYLIMILINDVHLLDEELQRNENLEKIKQDIKNNFNKIELCTKQLYANQ